MMDRGYERRFFSKAARCDVAGAIILKAGKSNLNQAFDIIDVSGAAVVLKPVRKKRYE